MTSDRVTDKLEKYLGGHCRGSIWHILGDFQLKDTNWSGFYELSQWWSCVQGI